MSERQLDFFSDIGLGAAQGRSQAMGQALVSAEIDDERLIAAIPESSLADSCGLAAEAGRRRLAGAIPALATLCRRFAGFGARRMVSEQAAAIDGLAMIGGRDAAHAVSEMIERAVVQGPTLQIAVSAAARLGSTLSPDALRQLLRHAEPGIRADACRCARPLPELILILIDLLDDLDRRVATSAASALGRMGRIEARPILKSLLRDDPSEDAIDAVSSIADEECAVLLGRIARSSSLLADAALISLESTDHDRAVAIAAAIRRLRLPRQNPGSGLGDSSSESDWRLPSLG
jgi:HEAT repeats